MAHTQFCGTPWRELIAVTLACFEHLRNGSKPFDASGLRAVTHASCVERRRARVLPQIEHVERA